nr:NADPH-dependent FMN reductase [Henriciella sp.]
MGLSGSLREGSLNSALLRSAQELMPAEAVLEKGSISGIPLYNGDDEATDGIPPAVQDLKQKISAADGLILFTPEYNNSIPGVFKNAIDWASRPSADILGVFGGKPVALAGASPGGFGTMLAQDAWLSVLRTLGTRPWFEGRLMVSRAADVFGETGELTDEKTLERLRRFLLGFTRFVQSQR